MAETQVRTTLTADTRPYVGAMQKAAAATTAVDKAAEDLQRQAGRNSLAWAAVGTAITIAGAKMVRALQQSVAAASNLNESTSKMQRVFGSASSEIERFATRSMGMSTRAVYDAASMMALFGKSAGLSGTELSKFSTEMVTLSTDLASFFNTSPEDAMQAIGSALRGESESIRRYNVLLDAATLQQRAFKMGIVDTTTKALTPQQRVLAAQAEILAQTSDAQGDYERTSDGLANSQRDLAAAVEDAQAALGEALLPVMADATQGAAGLLEAFARLPEPIRATATALAAVTAAAGLLGPGLAAAVKGLAALGITLSAGALGAIAVGLTAVGAAAVGVHESAEYQRGKGVEKMVESMKAAADAGREFDEVLSATLAGGEVITGVEGLVDALGRSELVAKQAAPAFEALDAYLTSMADKDAARAVFDGMIESATAAGISVDEVKNRLPEYMGSLAAVAQADAAVTIAEQEKAAAVSAAAAAITAATQAAYGYISANLSLAGSRDKLLGMEDRFRASILGPASGAPAGGTRAAASEAESKALQKTIDKIREKDRAEMDAEIKAAQRAAKRRAEARADAGARSDVTAGVKRAIDTDLAAKRGEDIDGFNQGGSVGEATGSLTKGEQAALDKKLDAIRARHKKSVDARIKGLQDEAKAQRAASGAAGQAAKVYTEASNSLDSTTDAGLRNRETMRGAVGEILAIAKAEEQAALDRGESAANAAQIGYDSLMVLRDGLVESAEKAGFTRDEVLGYLEEIKFADKDFEVIFKLVLETSAAEEKMNKLLAKWGPGKGKEYNKNLGAWMPVEVTPTKTPTTTTTPTGTRPTQDPRTGVYRASGGEIYGPGGPRSDSVPIWASRGEYIINAQQYAANRELVKAINAGSGRVSGGMTIGQVNVTEASGPQVRQNVIDALAESAYRLGAVR